MFGLETAFSFFFFWNCFFKDHKISHNHQIWSLSVLSHLDLFQYLTPLIILFFWNVLLPELYDTALSWYYSFLLTVPFSSSVVPYLANPLCSIHLFISIFSPLIISSALTIVYMNDSQIQLNSSSICSAPTTCQILCLVSEKIYTQIFAHFKIFIYLGYYGSSLQYVGFFSCGMWHLSSVPTGDGIQAPCIGSLESYLLDHLGCPRFLHSSDL